VIVVASIKISNQVEPSVHPVEMHRHLIAYLGYVRFFLSELNCFPAHGQHAASHEFHPFVQIGQLLIDLLN
jgi:hypothetical protein